MSAIELQPRPDYKTAAHSSNTRRAYASDLKHYSQAGYRLPAKPEELTDYLIDSSGIPSLKKRSIQKNIASITLRDEIKKRMPERNLLDIMCLAQNTSQWASCFSPVSGLKSKLGPVAQSPADVSRIEKQPKRGFAAQPPNLLNLMIFFLYC